MEIEVIEKACPVCHEDVKGNDEKKFFCKHCNVLFDRKHLNRELPPPKNEMPRPPQPTPIKGVKKEILETKFIVSLKSDKYHFITCTYISKIHEENLFYFNTESEAESRDYVPCVCIKNKILSKHKYVMAKEGEDYHIMSCPYAQKILEENRIYFNEEAFAREKNLNKCTCLIPKV